MVWLEMIPKIVSTPWARSDSISARAAESLAIPRPFRSRRLQQAAQPLADDRLLVRL